MSASSARHSIKTLRADGTWPDVDYKNRQRSSWLSALHLYRVRAMAEAYAHKGHELAGDPKLREAIVRALGHWLEKDYQNPNWWWNRIGVPKQVDRILLLMGDAIPKKYFDKAVNGILSRPGIGMTGQNKVWVAGITLNRGVLLKDEAMVRKARDAIVSEIRVTTSEGIQPDFSYHQHGPQQQFGNYGLSFVLDQLQWASILEGTAFALDAKQKEILKRYLLDGLAWVVRQGVMDISSCGRQIGPGYPESKGRAVMRALGMIGQADTSPVGHRHFWRSDMAVYRQRDFYITVKMSSRRVIGTETCNTENMQGYYLGDGATYTYRDNKGYHDIFPAWNWRRLPGVTAPQGTRKLVPNRKTQNQETFVGGVSDGKEGVAAMIYARDGLTARKAWFFCGPVAVCLGAGISCKGNEQVLTGVEQRLSKGVVTVSAKGPPRKVEGESVMDNVHWVHHDEIGYFFPGTAKVTLFAGQRKGTWRSIASKFSTSPVSHNIFELCIDHGKSPKDSSYAWITVPVVKLSQMNGPDGRLPKILSNTPALQAIEAGQLVHAVFYDKGRLEISGGRSISVDAPCILMLRGATLSIADPTHKLEKIAVTLSGREKKTVAMPKGGNAGSTVTVRF